MSTPRRIVLTHRSLHPTRRLLAVLLVFAITTVTQAAPPRDADTPAGAAFDVVVYGATPGGIAAAVNAARQGARTVLLQPDGHLGGLTSGGLSNTDFKSFESLGGTFREFMQRVEAYYAETFGPDSQQVIDCVKGGYYEPKVARLVFEQMLQEAGVTTLLWRRLVSTETPQHGQRRRITSARFEHTNGDGEIHIQGRVFIDGTYEGDLIAAAGVAYRLGCESKDEYGESRAFDQPNDYVQTYNFRVCLTRDPQNRLPLPKPEHYDRSRYAPLLTYLEKGVVQSLSQQTGRRPVLKIRPMPNLKADFNDVWESPVSLSVENINHPWPTGSPQVRQRIYQMYKDHSLGLFYFLANDPGVPESWRKEMQQWGLPKDEFVESGHWSPALYVREGRRMVGAYVFTEHDTQVEPGREGKHARARLHPDSIAIGDYNHNCHGVWAPAPGEPSIGHFTHYIAGPFQVPYGVLLPKEVDGLLAPAPVSSSHVGFCALRMEPTWTALGQAAGVAAAMAIRDKTRLRDLDVTRLQLRLHELGALTIYVSDLGERMDIPRPSWDRPGTTFRVNLNHVPPRSPYFRAVQFFGTKGFFHGLIDLDAEQAKGKRRPGSTGQWSTRFHNHFIKPDQPIDHPLATRWLKLAGKLGLSPTITADQAVHEQLSRGALLNRLFEAVR